MATYGTETSRSRIMLIAIVLFTHVQYLEGGCTLGISHAKDT